eukprot:403358953
MVAEIKNFYDQAHRLKHFTNDQQYNEHLANLSNRFLEIMSKTIHKYGGDIVQFIGNSLICIWPRSNNPLGDSTQVGREDDDIDSNIARKAAQCALDIKNESQKIISNRTEIHMGLGFGHCGILHVGGVMKRAEYFIIGDGLSQALRSLRLASSTDSVIISKNLWQVVDKFFVCEELLKNYEHERSVKYLFGPGIRSKSNTNVLRSEISEHRLREIQVELKTYIPAAFRPYVKIKRDTYGNEHRRITVMVLNMEIENMYQSQSFVIIQKIVEIIQQQIYKLEGSFHKIISYDGGLTVVSTWGISPLSHEDDATRAVLCAINIQKELNLYAQQIAGVDFQIPIHIGISTGNVFMGIVGNEGSRKEIVTLGETIERAFLFMQTASKHYGKIYVDYDTKMEASLFIDFRYIEHVEFAHKLTNQAIFEPVDPNYLWYENKYVGKYIAVYSAQPSDSVWVLAIKGEAGSGKSLFVRNLIQQVIMQEKFILKTRNEIAMDVTEGTFPSEVQFKLIVSSCNASIEKKFIGVWIPILREMLFIYSKVQNKRMENVLNTLIKNSDTVIQEDQNFTKVQGYTSFVEEDILFFLHELLFEIVTKLKDDILFFIIIDNVSMMDRSSWRLFELITSEIDNLIIVMCIQSVSIDIHGNSQKSSSSLNFKISNSAYNYYQERLQDYERELFNVVEMEPITSFDLRQILIDIAETYEKDMKDEIFLMTQIIDSNNSIKSYHGQLEIKNKMIKRFQVYDFFKEVEKENDFINIREQILLSTNKLRYFFKTNCWNNIQLPPYSLKQNCCLIEQAFLAKGSYAKLSSEMAVSAYQLLKAASVFGDRFSMNQVKEIFIFDDQNNYHLDLLFRVLENRNLIEMVYEDGSQGDKIYRFNQSFLRECLFQLQIYEGQRKQLHSKISHFLQENMIYNWQTDWNFEKEQTILLQNLMAEEGVQNERQLSLKARQALVIKKVNACILSNQNVVKRGPLILEKSNTKKTQFQRYVTLTSRTMSWFKDKLEWQKGLEIGNVSLDQILKVTVLKNPFQIQADKNKSINVTNISMSLDQTNVSMNASIIDVNKKANLLTFQVNQDNYKYLIFKVQCNEWNKKGVITKGSRTISFIAGSRREGEEWVAYIEYLRTKANFDHFVNKFGKVKFPISQFESSHDHNKQARVQIWIRTHEITLHIFSYETLFFDYKQQQLCFPIVANAQILIFEYSQEKEPKEKHRFESPKQQLSLQFMEHMQLNACKFNEENSVEESSQINVINHKTAIKDQILDKIEHLTKEDNEGSIQNLHQAVSDDMLEEIKREYQEHQMFNIQDDKDMLMTMQDPNLMQTAHLNNDQSQNQLGKIANLEQLAAARRATIFNPGIIDHNISNLRRIGSKMQFGFHRLSTIKRKSNNENISQLENLVNNNQFNNEQIDETLSFDDDQTLEEVKDQLFDENWHFRETKVALPIKQFPFYEGIQVVQYISIKNDIQFKQDTSKLTRRKKVQRVQQNDLLENQENLLDDSMVQQDQQKSKSIMKLQQDGKNDPRRHKKAQAMSKILEQTKASKQFKAREEYRKLQIQTLKQLQKEQIEQKQRNKDAKLIKSSKNKHEQIYSEQEYQAHFGQKFNDMRVVNKNILIEQLENYQDSYTEQNIMRAQNSVAFLQTLAEVDQSPEKQRLKHKNSKISKASKKVNQTRVFKPTPSERQLNWIEREESVRKINAYRDYLDNYSGSEFEEDEQPYYDNDTIKFEKRDRLLSDNIIKKSPIQEESCEIEESMNFNLQVHKNISKISQQLLSDRSPGTRSKKSQSPYREKQQESAKEVLINRDGVICMSQDQKLQDIVSRVRLNKSDRLRLIKDIPGMNLALCLIKIQNQDISVFVPRDSINVISVNQSPSVIKNNLPSQSSYQNDRSSKNNSQISPALTERTKQQHLDKNQISQFGRQANSQFNQTSNIAQQLNSFYLQPSRNDKLNKAHTDVQNSREQSQGPLVGQLSNYDTFSSPLKDQELLSQLNGINLADGLKRLHSQQHQQERYQQNYYQTDTNQHQLRLQHIDIKKVDTLHTPEQSQHKSGIRQDESQISALQNHQLVVSDQNLNQREGQQQQQQSLKLQERKKKRLEQQVAEQVLKNALENQMKEGIANAAAPNLKMLERKRKKQMASAQSIQQRQDETPQRDYERY